MRLIFIKVIKNFKYRKNNNRYRNKVKLYKQVIKKVLSIANAFYLRYLLYFLFYNITSYFVYAKVGFLIKIINKKIS